LGEPKSGCGNFSRIGKDRGKIKIFEEIKKELQKVKLRIF